MATQGTKQIIEDVIEKYIRLLREHKIPVWRLYLYGSYARGTHHADSDIDLAVFWDADSIDGFNEDAKLLKLTRNVDLRIEPHSFARTDFDEPDPYVDEIIRNGKRIL
jgi:predicted nucleotidyltransferase